MFRYTKVYLLLDLRNTPSIYYTNTNRKILSLQGINLPSLSLISLSLLGLVVPRVNKITVILEWDN